MAEPGPHLLIVDDDRAILEALSERFSARGYRVDTAGSGAEAEPLLRRTPDVVLCDLEMADGDGMSVLRAVRELGIDTTVIVITAYGTIDKAVAAMRAGAWDFVQKPFQAAALEEVVRRATEHDALRRRDRAQRAALLPPGIVAEDSAMRAVLALVGKAAVSPATVLLLGESGTGKEVLARTIHEQSPRATGPFVAINCAAMSEGLLESELFGHEKGAFTGAIQRRAGRIELAHRGTLFLDEIGDVTPAFQTRLLRVLQERSFERVGGNRTIEVDLRVVAATNRDLAAAVREGAFREDLYYRLNVIAIALPPLRDRRADVMPLAERFVAELAAGAKRAPVPIEPAAAAALRRYDWPGNVRELRNVVERALVLCEDRITLDDLPPELAGGAADGPGDGFHAQVEAFRRELIRGALEAEGGSRTRAAERLGLQRTYLARLIRQYGLGES